VIILKQVSTLFRKSSDYFSGK